MRNSHNEWIVIRPSGNRSDILLAAADGADQQAAVGNQTGGRVGFFLTVSNFDATLTRLVEWGAEIVGEPRDEPYGRIVVFVLRSGLTAHTYFDKYQFEADPRLLRAVARAMVGLVPAGTEVLAGLELGGVPVVTALSLETGLPACFVRKTAKEYGTARLAEGADIEGRSVLVVEDIVTTGGKVVTSTDDLRQRGAIIDTAVCVIDREQGGSGALTRAGISLKPLFTRTQAEQP
jgi:orotate phosphoribosyltransferase